MNTCPALEIHLQDFFKTFSGWLPRCFELL